MRLHDASQCVAFTAWTLGEAFGIDESQVHVTSPYVGGGFGGKTLWQHHALAAAAARMAGRPVRLSLSREGVYRVVGGRTETEQRVAIGADKDGVFKAMIQTGVRRNDGPQQHAGAVHHAGDGAVCGRDDEAVGRDGAYGHVGQHVHAGARSCAGELRAGIGRRRVGGENGDGPDRTAHPQRAGEGPGEGAAVLDAQPRAVLPRRGDPVRLERARRDRGKQDRWRMADRARDGVGDVSLPADARWRGADHHHGRGQGDRGDRGRRDGHGHHDDDGDGGRRSARPQARGRHGRDR